MGRLLNLGLVALIDVVIYVIFKMEIIRTPLFRVHSIGIIVASLLCCLLPKAFGIGIEGFKKAGLITRLYPILVSFILLFIINRMPLTYSTLIVQSYLLGGSISYFVHVILVTKGMK